MELKHFDLISIVKLKNNSIMVETTYGPLLLDEDDYKQFKFDPNWLIENIDSNEAYNLLKSIKQYYIGEAIKLMTTEEE